MYKNILLVFSLLLVLSSCQIMGGGKFLNPSDSASLKQADNYTLAGKRDLAIPLLENLATKHPNNTDIYYKLAENYRLSNNCKSAIPIYKSVMEKSAKDKASDAYLSSAESLGICFINEQEYNEAVITLNEVFEHDASRFRAINALGVGYALQGDKDQALIYFKIAQSLEEKESVVLNNMALAQCLYKNYDKALDLQKKAIKGVEADSENYKKLEFNLALIYGARGDFKNSAAILKKYLSQEQIEKNLKYYAKLGSHKKNLKQYISKSVR